MYIFLQILNAAYHVEVTFHSGSSVTRMLWEQIKQVGITQGSILSAPSWLPQILVMPEVKILGYYVIVKGPFVLV